MHEPDVDSLKERLDSEQIEGWRSWFGAYSPGGVRTPSDEVNDVLMSRLLSLTMNVNRLPGTRQVSVRDLMMFPPPMTQEEHDARIDHAKGSLRALFSTLGKKKAKK